MTKRITVYNKIHVRRTTEVRQRLKVVRSRKDFHPREGSSSGARPERTMSSLGKKS